MAGIYSLAAHPFQGPRDGFRSGPGQSAGLILSFNSWPKPHPIRTKWPQHFQDLKVYMAKRSTSL